MADEGGGNDNKLIFELDVENGQFNVKMGDAQSTFKALKPVGEGAFSAISLKAVGLNQALELGKKLAEAYHVAIELMGKTEAFDNQSTALKNLGKQLGVNTESLVGVIKKATGETITSAEAQITAFKLLYAGFKANQIPALVQFAEAAEKARGVKFEDTISALATAAETGNTRGLKPLGIEVEKTGDRLAIINTIMAQSSVAVKNFGDGYTDVSKKIETKSEETWNSVKKFFGNEIKNIYLDFSGDKALKAEDTLNNLRKQLDAVNKASRERDEIASKGGNISSFSNVDLQRENIQKKINELSKEVVGHRAAENEEIKKATASLGQERDLVKIVGQEAQKRLTLTADRILLEKQLESGSAIDIKQIYQDLYKVKKQLIEDEAQKRRSEAAGIPQSESQLAQKLIAIERERIEKVRALRIDDFTFQESQQNAQLAIMMNENFRIENAGEKHQEILVAQEETRHQRELESLRNSGLNREQFNIEVEKNEVQHQQRLKNIQDSANQINTKNFQLGWQGALGAMEKQYGGFTGFVGSMTNKMHSTVSNSFIAMAKAHKFSMDQMLQQVLVAIGEEMIQRGTLIFLSSIWPPQPPGLAAGAGLMAAGAVLVGAGSPAADGGGGGGSADFGGGFGGSGMGPTEATKNEMQKKHATIVIENMLNTRESANYLADVLRNTADVTDFAVIAQGKNYV